MSNDYCSSLLVTCTDTKSGRIKVFCNWFSQKFVIHFLRLRMPSDYYQQKMKIKRPQGFKVAAILCVLGGFRECFLLFSVFCVIFLLWTAFDSIGSVPSLSRLLRINSFFITTERLANEGKKMFSFYFKSIDCRCLCKKCSLRTLRAVDYYICRPLATVVQYVTAVA